jgi:hypothetical protein
VRVTPELVERLAAPAVERAMADLLGVGRETTDALATITALRKTFDAELAGAIAELARLRRRARAKFPLADVMYFDAEALEQASAHPVAAHRARRFTGYATVVDLCCGIGGDAMSLAGGAAVVGVELESGRLAMARRNVALVGRFVPVRADAGLPLCRHAEAVFADPARRSPTGRRVFDVRHYRPPLDVLEASWLGRTRSLAVKVHPGIEHESIPAAAEAEFVSLDGDMRECTLWYGERREAASVTATVLPQGVSMHGEPLQTRLEVGEVGAYLHEPDPAVIRAGLVGDLAVEIGAWALDPTIAYLSSDVPEATPFVRSYLVESVMRFNLKTLRAHLRSSGVGRVAIKKRGTAVDPEDLRRKLDLRGSEERTVILTRHRGEQVAIVCR